MTMRLTFSVSEATNDRLDEIAASYGSTKSEVLRKAIGLIDLAESEHRAGNRLGVFDEKRQLLKEIVGL